MNLRRNVMTRRERCPRYHMGWKRSWRQATMILIYTLINSIWGDGWMGKSEDLSFMPSMHVKSWACWYVSIIPTLKGRNKWTLGAHWPAGLSSQWTPSSGKTISQKNTVESNRRGYWASFHGSTLTGACTHIHMHKQQKRTTSSSLNS